MASKLIDEKELFNAARQIAAPEQRLAYLQTACGGDPAAMSRLLELLRVCDQDKGFLEAPGANGATVDEPIREHPGTVIGPYKLLEQIGEGGFGVVFMAEQTVPVRRKVALKVLKPGMDTRHVVARFEAERQALAIMDHPNIAKVHDGGATLSGRPYFVMELVKGSPITDFCDQNQLAPRRRLELFVAVCQAVQHAHQKGIIHRDLKPSNVLVAQHDTTPVVKVIDFGVAKALGQDLTDKTLFTGFAQMIGTPLYMSPEQAGQSALDVDTRSDIYSLGVLLYELLTGTTPFDKDRFKQSPYDEICRIIREEEPPRPSTRLAQSTETLASIAAQRHTEPAKLTRLVRGELDWIVMKALEKDRNRRYETASAFAMDVQRYLSDEPVQACPPSAFYRFRKFARRNLRALATSALLGLLVLLASGAIAGSVGWTMRDRHARRVAVVARFDQVLQESERLYHEGRLPEATAIARKAQGVLDAADDRDEELQRRLREWLADLDMVVRLEAVRLRWNDVLGVVPDYAEAFHAYGMDPGALAGSDAAGRIAARSIRVDLAVALDVWAWRSRDLDLGQRLREIATSADPDPVRSHIREVLRRPDPAALRNLAETLDVGAVHMALMHMLGQRLWDAGEKAVAIAFLRRVQQQHPDDFGTNYALAEMFFVGPPRSLEETVRYCTAAIALRPDSGIAHYRLGRTLFLLRRLDDSIAAYRRLVAVDPQHRLGHRALAGLLAMTGRPDEAISVARASPYLLQNDDAEIMARLLNDRARQLCTHADPRMRDLPSAVELASEAVTRQPTNPTCWETLGIARYRAGQWQAAVDALQKWNQLQPPGDGTASFFLAMALWQSGNQVEARKRYDHAAQWADRSPSQNDDVRRVRTETEELIGSNKPK
jgi:serine/threonine protein kinase